MLFARLTLSDSCTIHVHHDFHIQALGSGPQCYKAGGKETAKPRGNHTMMGVLAEECHSQSQGRPAVRGLVSRVPCPETKSRHGSRDIVKRNNGTV